MGASLRHHLPSSCRFRGAVCVWRRDGEADSARSAWLRVPPLRPRRLVRASWSKLRVDTSGHRRAAGSTLALQTTRTRVMTR